MGRRCGGYGIWTTDATPDPVACRSRAIALSTTASATTLSRCSSSETLTFEWFTTKSLAKLPGPFILRYWDTLIVQMSLQEPAVLYAVLALSIIHRSGSEDSQSKSVASLRHYTAAIGHLSRHLAHRSRQSTVVALVACLAFVSHDFLSGSFNNAIVHLRNGVRILRESDFIRVDKDRLALSSCASQAEADLFRAIARQNLLVYLFDYSQAPGVSFELGTCVGTNAQFSELSDAWDALEVILNDIMQFRTRHELFAGDVGEEPASLCAHGSVTARLRNWRKQASELSPTKESDAIHRVLFHLLQMWYHLTIVLASYDTDGGHSSREDVAQSFRYIVQHACISRELRFPATPRPTTLTPTFNMSHSLVDVGWIPPLYFTATRCPSIDTQLLAIELIESATHREGIWDSRLAARKAREAIQNRERLANVPDEISNSESNDLRSSYGYYFTRMLGIDWSAMEGTAVGSFNL